MPKTIPTHEFHAFYRPSEETLTEDDIKGADERHIWTVVMEDVPATWSNELVAIAGRRPNAPRFVGYVLTTEAWEEEGMRGIYYDPMDP